VEGAGDGFLIGLAALCLGGVIGGALGFYAGFWVALQGERDRNGGVDMVDYKIENFFGHLDRERTKEAVAHGLALLTPDEIIEVLKRALPDEDHAELVGMLLEEAQDEGEDPF
jgi:hypothetical protein